MAANDNDSPSKDDKRVPRRPADMRRERQAEALRANLRKRKEQTRRRRTVVIEPAAEQDTD